MNEMEMKERLKLKEKNLMGAEENQEGVLLGAEAAVWSAPPESAADADAADAPSHDVLEMPPPFIDVTTAVQYICDSNKIIFHPGYSKSALMGFCDPSPSSAEKILVVYFAFQGRPYKAILEDVEGGMLPEKGETVQDSEEALLISNIAHATALK